LLRFHTIFSLVMKSYTYFEAVSLTIKQGHLENIEPLLEFP
jgi:hypothetical protein